MIGIQTNGGQNRNESSTLNHFFNRINNNCNYNVIDKCQRSLSNKKFNLQFWPLLFFNWFVLANLEIKLLHINKNKN